MTIDGESKPDLHEIADSRVEFGRREQEKAPRIGAVLGYAIESRTDTQKKLAFDPERKTVVVNPELYPSPALAEVAAATLALRQAELENILRSERPEEIKKLPKTEAGNVGDIALWTSIHRLKDSDRQTLSTILENLPPTGSYTEEVKQAFLQYVATGDFPQVSEHVQPLLVRLPVSKQTGRNLLEAMADGAVTLGRKLNYYRDHVLPILAQARELDRQLEATVRDSFKPSTESSEGEPLDESQIHQRVHPYYGGYYREQVFDGVDWPAMHVVSTSGGAERHEGRELGDGEQVTQYEFTGTDGQKLATGPLSLPLPATAGLVRDTLTPGLVIKRDGKGIYLLTHDERVQDTPVPQEYRFRFVLRTTPPDFSFEAPSDDERTSLPASDLFAPETLQELSKLGELNLTSSLIAKRIVARIHREIEYVNSDEVGALLGEAGPDYFRALEDVKKADCDVANFYLIAQLRSQGIPARMVTGYYITDRSYGYAPIAGTKHAWTEYYDEALGQWRRIDATPPKRVEEEPESEDEDQRRGTGGEEMLEQADDVLTSPDADVDDEGLELTAEQLAQFTEYVRTQFDKLSETVSTIERNTKDDFLREHGITPEQWQTITEYMERVNKTVIRKEETIDKLDDSTLGKEWKKFFDLFLVAYRIPAKTQILQVRQSLGDDLTDPSSAGIDLLSGSDDPYGFEKRKRGEQEIRLPIDFSNDYLLDLTASMEAGDGFGHTLKDFQKMFVMSALYHGYEINQQLKYYEGELARLPFISNHLISIHGNNRYRELTSGEREITLSQLYELFQLLDKTEQGAGDILGALQAYRDRLLAQPNLVQRLKTGDMVKTLTVLSDGNLWCSNCGRESCNVYLHAETTAKAQKLLGELRGFGVIVNGIGFTEKSRPVISLVNDPARPGSGAVVPNAAQAVALHHGQMIRSWETIGRAADRRRLSLS